MQKYIRALGLSLMVLSLWGPQVLAQSKKAKKGTGKASQEKSKSPDPKSDRVDISDVENKYWAPKDTDFSVVQNRTYPKEGRFAVSLQSGPLVNDSYSSGLVHGLRVNYYFSERYGVELNYYQGALDDNDSVNSLKELAQGGAKPNYNVFESSYGVGFNYVPVYAKASVLGKRIVYFDLSVSPYLGMTNLSHQLQSGNKDFSAFTFGIDLTQQLFFSKYMALRLDLTNRWFKDETLRFKSGNGTTEGETVKDEIANITTILFGVTFFF